MGIRATLQKARELVNDACKELQKIGCLQLIAVAEARRGDQAAAASTLQELIDTAARLKSGRFFQVYPIVAVAQAQAEKGEKALAVANLNQALSNITDCGTFAGACEILREACVVAAKLGEDELLEDLLKRTFIAIDKMAEKDASLSANSKKAIILVDVSKVQSPEHARESIKRALGIAKIILEEQLKSAVYMEIIVRQALLNDLREARELFSKIQDKRYRDMAAPYLAEAMIRAGEIDEALKLVNEEEEPDRWRQIFILPAVGVAEAERGDIDGAMRIKQRISKLGADSDQKILSAVGKQKAKNGSPSEALKWAKAQPSNLDKIYALIGVAEGLLEKATIATVE
jgi:tetratricopeptide (TPR) repeat protein